MSQLNSAEERILKQVSAWKTKSPGYLTKATNQMSKPLLWAGDKLIPKEARSALGSVTELLVDKLQDVSQWSVSEAKVLESVRAFEIDSETILELKKASIFDLDHVAEEAIKHNSQLAAAEGFGTGLLGWPGLVADMPALFTLSFRTVYQIALCYGFQVDSDHTDDDDTPFEVGYMLRIFKVATAATKPDKLQAIIELSDYKNRMADGLRDVDDDETKPRLGGEFAVKQVGKTAAVGVSRILINAIVRNTFARKTITAIPGIGALLTAGFNYGYVNDVGEAAFHLYRERFLQEKKKRRESEAGSLRKFLFPED